MSLATCHVSRKGKTLQHSSDFGGFQAAATSKKREEKGRKEQGEEGVHGAGENLPLLREYGCYRDRPIISLDPRPPPAKSGPSCVPNNL